MPEPLPDALFFDAAGTLLTVAEPVGVSYSKMGRRHGIAASVEAVSAGFRRAWKESIDPLYPVGQPSLDDDRGWWQDLVLRTFTHALGEPPPAAALDAAFAELYEHFAKPSAWVLYPDTLPALKALRGRTRMLVLSNFDQRLRPLLDAFELSGFFEEVILSSQVGASKPHARMFQAALDAVKLPPARCLHVGDDPVADAEGAAAMGLPCWWINRPEAGLLEMVERWG